MNRSFLVSLLLFAALGTTTSYAAGAPKPPSAELRSSLSTVAVVAAPFVPKSNFITFAEGKGKGAAMSVATQITNALPGMNPSHTLVEGLLKALATETAVQIRSADAEGPGSPEEKPSYQSLRAQGIDTVLEVAVTSVGLTGGERTPFIFFFMDARTRFVRVADNRERYSRVFRFSGRVATLDAWIADNGRLLREQFTQGYESLADRIMTELFLLTPMKIRSKKVSAIMTCRGRGCQEPEIETFTCWLEPIYPGMEMRPGKYHFKPMDLVPFKQNKSYYEPPKLLFTVVDSLQPRLRWETFPHGKDLKKGLPISEVRYDLRIWKVGADHPGSLVYEREGLPEASHELEHPLEPGTKYLWSVRSRFKTDGRLEVTRWAFIPFGMGCNHDRIPASGMFGYFRFATP
jgi:hypothetical protein